MRTLTESERATITNGLRVAAERFDEHVKMFRSDEALGISPGAAESLASTFENQARESRAIAALIDDCKELSIEVGQSEAQHAEILSAVSAELNRAGIKHSLEHGGAISLPLANGGALICGTVNGNFGIDQNDETQNCIASFESEIPFDSSDYRAIAEFIVDTLRRRRGV